MLEVKKNGQVYKMYNHTFCKIQNKETVKSTVSESDMGVEDDILNNVPDEVLEGLSEDIVESVHDIMTGPRAASLTENTSNGATIETAHEPNEITDDLPGIPAVSGTSENDTRPQVTVKILNDDDLKLMHTVLQGDERANKLGKWNMNFAEFKTKFSDAKTIKQSFYGYELQMCLRPFIGKMKSHGTKIGLSSSKHMLVNAFSNAVGDGSTIQPVIRVRRTVTPLSTLARTALRNLPKDLNLIIAENNFPILLHEWYAQHPLGTYIDIESVDCSGQPSWYSRPKKKDEVDHYMFMILDAYHQICGVRRLVCSNGIPAADFRSSCLLKVAEESEHNGCGCGLTIAHVRDLIDKQSIANAVLTFSEKVEEALISIKRCNK